MINILLGTGIRVSEYCGLTVDDIDFVNRRFLVEKQIVYGSDCKLYVGKPKTAHSMRYIPITNQIEQSLKNLVEKSQKSNAINVVDGYHGFIVLKSNGKVQMHIDVDRMFERLKRAYNREHPSEKSQQLSPRVLRHTFCTNMANSGMDVKNLQYLMGHATVNITLNVYAHSSYEYAATQMFALAEDKSVV